MRHKRIVLYSFLPFLFISTCLTAQIATPPKDKSIKYDISDSIINSRYADSVPIKQRLPRTDRTIKSTIANCYVIEGDSIITGMKYTYSLYFVTEVHEKYCNGMIRKSRGKGWLPDSIYTMVWKQFENHKAKGLPSNADMAMNYFEEAKKQFSGNHNGTAIAGFLMAATMDKSVREAAFVNMGLGLFNLKLYEASIYYYQLAIKENPNSYEAYLNMGAAAKQLKNDAGFSMETVYFKIAYDLKPHAHKAIYNYATTLMSKFDKKNNDQAIKLLQEAVSLDPNNPTYTYTLGKAYYNKSGLSNANQGDEWLQKAIQQYDKAISIDQKFTEAYLSKARVLLALYESATASSDKKLYMDAFNACYISFKAIGGEDKTGVFKANMFKYPEEQQSVLNYNALISKGWKIRSKVEDDFNKDGYSDFALVVQEDDPAKMIQIIKYNLPNHPTGILNKNPSILYVALYNPLTKQYDVIARNNKFYEISNGYEDHLYKLSSNKGVLKITREYTSGQPYSFLFRYQNNKMEMIGREVNYLRKTGDHFQENYSINYSTKKLVYTITNLKTQKTSRFEYTDIKEPDPGDIENIKETLNLDNNQYVKKELLGF